MNTLYFRRCLLLIVLMCLVAIGARAFRVAEPKVEREPSGVTVPQTLSSSRPSAAWMSYKDDANSFEFYYPAAWDKISGPSGNWPLGYVSAYFQPHSTTTGQTLPALWVQAGPTLYERGLSSDLEVASSTVAIDGISAERDVYIWQTSVQDPRLIGQIGAEDVHFSRRSTLYDLQFTPSVSTKTDDLQMFDKILSTVRFTD